jgi:hypothetical protein
VAKKTALVAVFFAFAVMDVSCAARAQSQQSGTVDQTEGNSLVQKPWANGGKPYADLPEWRITGWDKPFAKIMFDPLLGLVLPCPNSAPVPGIKEIFAKADKEQNVALDKRAIVEKLVTLDKGKPGDPVIPDGLAGRVQAGMLAYPRSFLCFLLENRCRVYIAPLVIRADPDLEFMHPVSYAVGSTFLNCRAVYTSKGILIGSHFYRDGRLQPNLDPFHGVQHETAHAIDQLLGRPSLCQGFLNIYEEERDAVSVVDRAPLSYYLNGEKSGAIETFGQLLAHKYCHFTEHHTLALVRCFPRCVEFIDHFFPAADDPQVKETKPPPQTK